MVEQEIGPSSKKSPGVMLGYLTYKLKNQSLNDPEPPTATPHQKNDDDHDSGTESDDEGADAEELERYMGEADRQNATGSVPSDRASSTLETITDSTTTTEGRTSEERQPLSSKTDVESPLPDALLSDSVLLSDDTDLTVEHHSSEEELEVINSCRSRTASGSSRSTSRLGQYPEKRKWSQANRLTVGSGQAGRNSTCNGGGSSDEEVRDLMCASAPVEFRASPPANVPKPCRSLSPPPKLFHKASPHPSGHIPPHELCCGAGAAASSVSPRKRHRKLLVQQQQQQLLRHQKELSSTRSDGSSPCSEQRPSLDFEKMQQEMAK